MLRVIFSFFPSLYVYFVLILSSSALYKASSRLILVVCLLYLYRLGIFNDTFSSSVYIPSTDGAVIE